MRPHGCLQITSQVGPTLVPVCVDGLEKSKEGSQPNIWSSQKGTAKALLENVQ